MVRRFHDAFDPALVQLVWNHGRMENYLTCPAKATLNHIANGTLNVQGSVGLIQNNRTLREVVRRLDDAFDPALAEFT